ncbi:hypothetical protein E2C01_068804 [Portunus trituberculatus]|uniref:Uncharacterized protein n=1 Tax=Portunus trituberculatus TaxID=210409 RepID=A0A5B7HX68_PORTR|nr:hypothetical protein [Portunus trituberculatus]
MTSPMRRQGRVVSAAVMSLAPQQRNCTATRHSCVSLSARSHSEILSLLNSMVVFDIAMRG